MFIPVLRPLSFVESALKAGCENYLSKPQLRNLIWMVSCVIIGQRFCLSYISTLILAERSTNALSWFLTGSKICPVTLWRAVVYHCVKTFEIVGKPGRFIIDDTLEKHSKGAKVIHAVYWLWDHCIGAHVKARCVVVLYFAVSDSIKFPIGWRIYLKGGSKKYNLAKDLIKEALTMGFKVDYVLFDSWYAVSPLLNWLNHQNIKYICEIKQNNKIYVGLPDGRLLKLGIKEFFKCASFKCKKVTLGFGNGKQGPERMVYSTFCVTVKLCALNHKTAILYSTKVDIDTNKILITNDLRLEAKGILEIYSYRWLIEEFFGTLKGALGYEGARVRSPKAGALALLILFCADLLLSLKAYQQSLKHSESRLPTVSSVIAKAQKENLTNLLDAISTPEKGEDISKKWIELVAQRTTHLRRQRRNLAEIATEGLHTGTDG